MFEIVSRELTPFHFRVVEQKLQSVWQMGHIEADMVEDYWPKEASVYPRGNEPFVESAQLLEVAVSVTESQIC